MKSHNEILTMRTPIVIIEAKRKQMLYDDEGQMVTKLQEQGFDYQGDFEIYEFVENKEEDDELAKIIEKVENPYGWNRKKKGEEDV
jgi:hypothetical protein